MACIYPPMDGGPHQLVEPGGTWRPTWTIDQPAATLLYHPHPHGTTEEHVYRGLAGMFILDDTNPAAAALPHDYGVDDIPVIVQDEDVGPDAEFVLDDDGNEIGLLGSTILVNGTVGPYLEVTTELVRRLNRLDRPHLRLRTRRRTQRPARRHRRRIPRGALPDRPDPAVTW